MPDKHGDNKKKHDPKEQRKPRNVRNQKGEKKAEKSEEVKPGPKVTAPQKPVYEDPGPEFYKSLKRETDEIVKITEEEHSKYKKKEIQSNWAKYEMPIETYDEAEEQDVGADYDKLIQMPLSVGGHFQFKHEKSWDAATGPSPYDKYFNINMDNLATAVSTVPFYERNQLDKSLFTDTDILTMNNRATKYKQKYFKDKKYSTAETEAHDKIINLLKNKDEHLEHTERNNKENIETSALDKSDDIVLEFNKNVTNISPVNTEQMNIYKIENKESSKVNELDDLAELITEVPYEVIDKKVQENALPTSEMKITRNENEIVTNDKKESSYNEELVPNSIENKNDNVKTEDAPVVVTKPNPVIESPEDLEKWLDDFLDG